MSNQKKKKKTAAEIEAEAESARRFGKHMSAQKAQILLAVTLAACAMPVVLGVRLWDRIPQVVPTGLIGVNGEDDSLPRWAVVFAVPGLMCLLNLICHGQLYINQKRMTMPSRQVRLVGRWGFPVISVLFCSGLILESAGSGLSLLFLTPCILGLALMMLGAHLWDCPRDARLALRFSAVQGSETAWRAVHRFAGWLWMAAGLASIAGAMLTSGASLAMAVVVLAALALPAVYGQTLQHRL